MVTSTHQAGVHKYLWRGELKGGGMGGMKVAGKEGEGWWPDKGEGREGRKKLPKH